MRPHILRKAAARAVFISLLFVTLFGCLLRQSPGPTPGSNSGPLRPSTSPYTVYLPDVSVSHETSPIPTPLPTPLPTDPPTAQSPTGPTPLPPPVPKPNYGVQVHLFAGDIAQTLEWARGLGVGWVKQQVEWHTVEHGPDDLDWALLDQAVGGANAFGFKILLGVTHAPDWTRAAEGESGPPANYAEFGRFMGQLASRYRGQVAAYELWNEPNLAREWRGDTLDPARFVALVAEGARAIRAADPDAIVISGAPAVTGIDDGVTAIDDRVFLRGMYEAGIAQWVDGVGVHPYGFANPPDESVQDAMHVATSHNNHPSFFFRDTLEDYHAIMLEYGDTTHPLWATEFGWPSVEALGQVDMTGWEYAREVSEAQQAQYIVRAFQMGEERPWVAMMFLWNLNTATIWGAGDPTSAYSLLLPNGAYRPAYLALRFAQPLRQ